MFVCHVQIIYKSIFDAPLYYKLLLTVINCYPLIYTIVYCYKLILGERHIKYNGGEREWGIRLRWVCGWENSLTPLDF